MDTPNVILIVMDAARADHLSCYGYQRPTTPHIDRVAAGGVLYEKAISAAVWTVPSHASLFTGQYPSGHGLRGRNLKLRSGIPTLAEFLAGQGYQTLGLTANALIGPATGLARGFHQLRDVRNLVQDNPNGADGWRRIVNALYRRVYFGPRPHRETWFDNGAWRINVDMKRWLKSRGGEKRPFFIFANYMEPHLRYHPPRAFRERFLTPAQRKRWRRVNQNAWKFMSGDVSMSEADWDVLIALYDAELAYLDMRLGQLVDALRSHGLLDNTLLIITADHGENLGEHGLMDHQYCVYDTLIRVPLIIRYPQRFPAGVRVSELVQTVDIFPTLVQLVESETSLSDRSLLPERLQKAPREFTVTEYLAPQLHSFRREDVAYDEYFARQLRALRTDRHKYIWASDGRHELYDLNDDPGETQNLINDDPETAAQLATRLEQWLDKFAAEAYEETAVDEEIIRRLEALGYIA